jgi:hypothetical protein
MTREILGIDPGETVGWALLEVGAGQPRRIDSGSWKASEISLAPFAGMLVGIERPARPHAASLGGGSGRLVGIVTGLLTAAWIGGEIAGRVRAAGGTVAEVSAAEARRAIGVRIGGARRGPCCETCGGSGAGEEPEPGTGLTRERAAVASAEMRHRAAEIRELDTRHARGRKKRAVELKALRLRACAVCPCPDCGGSGELRPPTVDQQVAVLVPQVIAGWPARSNVHERDAAVVALMAAQVTSLQAQKARSVAAQFLADAIDGPAIAKESGDAHGPTARPRST